MKTVSEEKNLCELCKQPVEITGFYLPTPEGIKQFCCEGCLSIYQLLNQPKKSSLNNNN